MAGSAPVSTTTSLDRFVQQRDEWQRLTCAKLVAPVERILRDIRSAAVLLVQQQEEQQRKRGGVALSTEAVAIAFHRLVNAVTAWTDDECSRELSESVGDIDACIRMAVRAHATVMVLSTQRACHQTIRVPTTCAFLRAVVVECGNDHEPDAFGSTSPAERAALRAWIERAILTRLSNVVPVSLFAADEPSAAALAPAPAAPVPAPAAPVPATPTSAPAPVPAAVPVPIPAAPELKPVPAFPSALAPPSTPKKAEIPPTPKKPAVAATPKRTATPKGDKDVVVKDFVPPSPPSSRAAAVPSSPPARSSSPKKKRPVGWTSGRVVCDDPHRECEFLDDEATGDVVDDAPLGDVGSGSESDV